jgi:hypothetical protein
MELRAGRDCWILASVEGGLEYRDVESQDKATQRFKVPPSALYGAERRGRSWLWDPSSMEVAPLSPPLRLHQSF